MKKLRIILCLGAVLLLGMCVIFLLNGNEKNDMVEYSKSSHSKTCSEEGYFYIGDDMLIHFVSAITKEDMIFCFNPVCEHDAYSKDSECVAACGNLYTFIHYHDKSIYVFNRVDMETHKVYRLDINNGTKELIATLPFSIQGNHIIINEGYAYYQAMVFVTDDRSQPEYIYYDLVELNIADGSYRMLFNLKESSIFRNFDVCDRKMFALKSQGDTEAALYHLDLDTLETTVISKQDELYNECHYIGMCDGTNYYYRNNVSGEIGIREMLTDNYKVLYKCSAGEEIGDSAVGGDKCYYSINAIDGKSKFFLYDDSENKTFEFTAKIDSYKVNKYCPYMEMFVLEPEDNTTNGNYFVVSESELKGEFNILKETETQTQVTGDSGEETTVISEEQRGKGQIINIVGKGDAKRLGVSKTLVWICPDDIRETTVNAFNELLVNKFGCDFVVEFHQYNIMMNYENENYVFADMVRDMKLLGHQADILFSGNFFEYDSFVDGGIYIPLTEYFATDAGQKLYNAYAPEVWAKTERNGHSYGYISKIYPAGRAILLCNEKVLKQYGITVPDENISFYDIGKYLEAADMSQENSDNKVILLSCDTDGLLLMEGYQRFESLSEGIFFKESDNGGFTAVNLATEDGFIKLVKAVKEYADNGWYVNESDLEKTVLNDNRRIELNPLGRYAFRYYYGCLAEIEFYDNKLSSVAYYGGKNFEQVITDVRVFSEAYSGIEPVSNMINGVTSWSGYKDEALKLMTLINTEAELSNLLTYGIEGEDYKYEDRLITSLKNDIKISILTKGSNIGNMNLLHSVFFEPDNKLVYSKEISANYKKGPTIMYDFDLSAYEEQFVLISEINNKYLNELFMGYCTDIDATIEAMREELAKTGIDEIIAEINRQQQMQ